MADIFFHVWNSYAGGDQNAGGENGNGRAFLLLYMHSARCGDSFSA